MACVLWLLLLLLSGLGIIERSVFIISLYKALEWVCMTGGGINFPSEAHPPTPSLLPIPNSSPGVAAPIGIKPHQPSITNLIMSAITFAGPRGHCGQFWHYLWACFVADVPAWLRSVVSDYFRHDAIGHIAGRRWCIHPPYHLGI